MCAYKRMHRFQRESKVPFTSNTTKVGNMACVCVNMRMHGNMCEMYTCMHSGAPLCMRERVCVYLHVTNICACAAVFRCVSAWMCKCGNGYMCKCGHMYLTCMCVLCIRLYLRICVCAYLGNVYAAKHVHMLTQQDVYRRCMRMYIIGIRANARIVVFAEFMHGNVYLRGVCV